MGRGKGNLITRGDSFIVDFYYKGERFRITLPGLSASKKAHHKTAEDIHTQIQADIARGMFNLSNYVPDHPKAMRFLTGSQIKLADRLNSWLEQKRQTVEKSTWRDYRSSVNYHLIPQFGHLYLTDISTAFLREWIYSLHISNKRINNILVPLRAVFIEAYQDDLIDKNPLDRIKKLPVKHTQVEPFERSELDAILQACEGQIRNIFQFAFWTGLRTGELIALKWGDINLVDGTVFIRSTRNRMGDKDNPKTKSSIRKLKLLKPAWDALNAQHNFTTSGHVFLNPSIALPWKDDSPLRKTAWIPALKRAGVKYRKPYATRHTFASMMLSAGMSPMWVVQQMGHTNLSQLISTYGKWMPSAENQLEDRISYLWTQTRQEGQ